MALLSVVRDVCAVVGVQQPTSVTSNLVANRTMQEMLALANEMAQRIAYDTRDWTINRTLGTVTGDGVIEAFPLPANYKRMLLTTNIRTSASPNIPLEFVPDEDEWIRRKLTNSTPYPGGMWILSGSNLHIWPVLPVGVVAYYLYLDKNFIALTSGGYGDSFMADTDTFRLDERLLKLGMIWQWKQNKGTSYAEDMGTYTDALAMAMGHDRPAPIIVGRHPISANARVAYPWPTP